MRKTLFLAALPLLASTLASCGGSEKTIAVIKLGDHTSLDEIQSYIVDTLAEKGYDKNGYKIETYNAAFSMDTASQIVSSIKEKVSIAIPIATPVAQACYNGLKTTTPIVFAAVSDPVGAGIVKNLEAPESNITGTSDAIQVSSILDKAVLIDPDLDELGYIYNPSEANSIACLAKVQEYCTTNDITLRTSTISAAGEMGEIASVIAPKCDAIFVSDDNTVASAMTALSSACLKESIPLYTGVDSMVRDGGMLCLGISYEQLGKTTANMAIEILGGKAVKDVPVKIFDDDLKLYLNTSYVSEIGLELPSEILNDPNLVRI